MCCLATVSIRHFTHGAMPDTLRCAVWVCSGQSNMQYPIGKPGCWNAANPNCTTPPNDPQCVCSPRGEYPSTSSYPHGCGCINQTDAEVEDMKNFPKIRLLQIFPSYATYPQLEANNSGWRPAPQLAQQQSANFSAVCVRLRRQNPKVCTQPLIFCGYS